MIQLKALAVLLLSASAILSCRTSDPSQGGSGLYATDTSNKFYKCIQTHNSDGMIVYLDTSDNPRVSVDLFGDGDIKLAGDVTIERFRTPGMFRFTFDNGGGPVHIHTESANPPKIDKLSAKMADEILVQNIDTMGVSLSCSNIKDFPNKKPPASSDGNSNVKSSKFYKCEQTRNSDGMIVYLDTSDIPRVSVDLFGDGEPKFASDVKIERFRTPGMFRFVFDNGGGPIHIHTESANPPKIDKLSAKMADEILVQNIDTMGLSLSCTAIKDFPNSSPSTR